MADDDSDRPVELMGGNGEALPFTLRDDPANPPGGRLLVPVEPLPEGTVRFRAGICGPESGSFLDNVFTVGPPAPLPTRLGSVTVGSSARYVDATPGLCVPFVGAAVPITLHPTPELEAYGELVQFTLVVDGAVWAKERYGRTDASAATKVDLVYARCPPDLDAGAPSGLALGRHHGELRAHLAGAPGDLPSVEFDFDLSCDFPDGGAPDGPAPDGPATNGGEAGTKKPSPAGGCQIAAGGGLSPSSALPLVLLLTALVELRRARRRSR